MSASDTHEIDREALFDELERRGDVVRCPACQVGRIPPELAEKIRASMPTVDRAADTPREMPAAAVVEPEEE